MLDKSPSQIIRSTSIQAAMENIQFQGKFDASFWRFDDVHVVYRRLLQAILTRLESWKGVRIIYKRPYPEARNTFTANCHLLVSFLAALILFRLSRTYFDASDFTSPFKLFICITTFVFPTFAYYRARLLLGDPYQGYFLTAGLGFTALISYFFRQYLWGNLEGAVMGMLPLCTWTALAASTISHDIARVAELTPVCEGV